MVISYNDSVDQSIPTSVIIIIVIVSMLDLLFLIACMVFIICRIKHCNRPSNKIVAGQILQQYSTSPNHSPEDSLAYLTFYPIHSSSGPEFNKASIL
ncbi:unnamed protein product [Rotaria sp. Silwood1]|nr:unnamed protein product [Rotaria sp. Silwood1]CAF3401499.1 unnamed protein product [Rotaria sp. Silwood1]CAF3433599.1 unnamed protein product [Rotaria sp. Silwood1]CAF4619620.1 unnamed protein product [Rotaria sp. Silwood1]CAF4901073.1 unnamed protein product [Rotaria sp. Silwood1]